MNTVLKIASGAIALSVLAVAAKAQEEMQIIDVVDVAARHCATQENDIARLQCYDSHYAAVYSEVEHDLDTLRENFLKYAESDPTIEGEHDEMLTFGFDQCHMSVTQGISGLAWYDHQTALTIYRWEVDLRRVEKVDYARFSGVDLEVRMFQEAPVEYIRFEGTFAAKGDVALNGHSIQETLQVAHAEEVEHFSKLVLDIPFSADEATLPEIRNRFEKLVNACKSEKFATKL